MQGRWYQFGPFRLEPATQLVLRRDRPLPLTPKAVETLRVLVENSGNLVAKATLLSEVWPESVVEEGSLTRNISDLRKALAGASRSLHIETVPKRGYRFVGAVRENRPDDRLGGRKVAVLPLRPLGRDRRVYRLGLGIADALVTKLATIRECVVRPSSAPVQHRDGRHDPIETGRRLGVEVVVDGSVQRTKRAVRVNIRLLDTASGVLVWGETFEEPLNDVLTCQDAISEELAGAVALWLTAGRRKLLSRRYAGSRQAYQLYLMGRFQWSTRTEGGLRKSIHSFRQAVADDPEYALAYSGLAASYALLPMLAPLPAWEFMPRARAAAINALEIDDSLAEARSVLAFVKWHYDWDWVGAEREFKRILRFQPDDAVSLQWYSLLLSEQGRFTEAVAQAKAVQRLDPRAASVRANVATVLAFAGRYERAIEEAERALALDAGSVRAHLIMGVALEQTGMPDRAIAALERASVLSRYPGVLGALAHAYGANGRTTELRRVMKRLEQVSRGRTGSYAKALASMGAGRLEGALHWLEQACEDKDFMVVQLKVDRRLDRLRSNARFRTLLARVGLLN